MEARSVLVTGSSRGLGKELAKAFGKDIYEQKTLLGVDLVKNSVILRQDVAEKDIINALTEHENLPSRIIVTPIGGQGFIFGRGNQQISAKIINLVGKNNIDIIATYSKIQSLPKPRLLVDTGSEDLNTQFFGYVKVLVDFDTYIMVRIEPV